MRAVQGGWLATSGASRRDVCRPSVRRWWGVFENCRRASLPSPFRWRLRVRCRNHVSWRLPQLWGRTCRASRLLLVPTAFCEAETGCPSVPAGAEWSYRGGPSRTSAVDDLCPRYVSLPGNMIDFDEPDSWVCLHVLLAFPKAWLSFPTVLGEGAEEGDVASS